MEHVQDDDLKKRKRIGENPLLKDLSKREMDVFMLLLLGKKNKDIAEELFISESAVKKHVASIFRKTNTKTRCELFAKLL